MRAWRCLGGAGRVRVHAAPNGLDSARVGLSVPGLRTSVARNRARRRLRAAAQGIARHHGFDLIVSADASALTVTFGLLRDQVETAAQAAVGRARSAPGPTPTRPARGRAQNGGENRQC